MLILIGHQCPYTPWSLPRGVELHAFIDTLWSLPQGGSFWGRGFDFEDLILRNRYCVALVPVPLFPSLIKKGSP